MHLHKPSWLSSLGLIALLQYAPAVFANVKPGVPVKSGTELRILPLGDSITWGYNSPDGNGYRLELYNNLAGDKVVMAGAVQSGNMIDNWNAGYPGQTIQYIIGQAANSYSQTPNIVLFMAGTNDMNPDPNVSKQGTDATQATQRLSNAVDQLFKALPDAVVLLAKIPNAGNTRQQEANIQAYNNLIPNVVKNHAGKHIQLVDMSVLRPDQLIDNLHPNEAGYRQMGDIWYQAIHNIPSDWIKAPSSPDPSHGLNTKGTNTQNPLTPADDGASINSNGGPATDIPAPVWNHNPPPCNINHNQFHQNWSYAGKIAAGIGRDGAGVRLWDVDNDGKADYLWLDKNTGELLCYKNNWPNPYTPCGKSGDVIASGAGPRDKVFFGYLKGDKRADYLVVNGDTGEVQVFWNLGLDANAPYGWRFVPGDTIATGVPHSNLFTLEFADMSGSGRSDYVVEGANGALELFKNSGQKGSFDITFINEHGIATGASKDISRVKLADLNGDSRADYLVFDDQGGITGFLNVAVPGESIPLFGTPGPVMGATNHSPDSIIMADIDGNGLADYCFVGDDSSLTVWFNFGSGDGSCSQ